MTETQKPYGDPMIKKGDIVIVNFNASQYTLSYGAEVLHIPGATGDSWIFKDIETGDIHYISEGCTITKVNESSNKKENVPF